MLEGLGVFPERAREVGSDQSWRDGVHAHVVGPMFGREILHELHVGDLGDRVRADHGVRLQSTGARDDDDRPVLPLDHFRQHHVAQPVIALDVRGHDLVEGRIGDVHRGAVVGIDRGVADRDVDASPLLARLVDQGLQGFLLGDARRDRDRLAGAIRARGVDLRRNGIAGLGLAARDDDLRAVGGKLLRDRPADPPGRTGDDGDLTGQVEQVGGDGHGSISCGLC